MSAVETAVPSGTWAVDQHHAQIEYSARHMGIATIRGRFSDFDVTLVGGAEPSLSGVIRVASVDSGDGERDAHTRSPDLFDADRYPEAKLVATKIDADRVVADLTLKGVTKEITLAAKWSGPSSDPWGNERLGLELEGEIDRSDFGVSFNAPLPGGGFIVGNDVKIRAGFEFLKQS